MTETTATEKQNAKLEHVAGGSTTRDDALDAGVPMLQGDPSERVGPEDALGVGDKRGDYRDRVPGNPYETVPNPNAGQPITAWVKEDGSPAKKGDKGATEVVVDYEPNAVLAPQRPRTEDIGDVKGKKGGVDTAAEAA
jgi:hypothetical protein